MDLENCHSSHSAYSWVNCVRVFNSYVYMCLFVLRFYGPVSLMAISLPNHTFSEQADNQYCAHSFARSWQLPFLVSGRETITAENISWSNLHERMLPARRGSDPQPPDHQWDAHPTEPPRPVYMCYQTWLISLPDSPASFQLVILYYYRWS